MVSRKGIDVKDETHIFLPNKYWIGNQTHNTDSILPLFDIRLESHAERIFISNNLITEFEFFGDLFHNSEQNGTKVCTCTSDFSILLKTDYVVNSIHILIVQKASLYNFYNSSQCLLSTIRYKVYYLVKSI